MDPVLPPPLVPIEADLTDFRFMPIEHARLRRSRAWLICKRRPELAFWQINLWIGSWTERPAGSLEDDDDVLADVAMCSPDRWQEVKADVLRGWIKCSDGRLYHPVVAEKVLEAWNSKLTKRWQNECDRVRKENHRRSKDGLEPLEIPIRPAKVSAGHPMELRPASDGNPPESALKGREYKGRDINGASAGNPADGAEVQLAFDAWNEAASRNERWPRAHALTGPRRTALAARLRDAGGIEGFRAILAIAQQSEFIRNEMSGFGLDWFLKAANFIKVREGNYNRGRLSSQSEAGRPPMQI